MKRAARDRGMFRFMSCLVLKEFVERAFRLVEEREVQAARCC